MPRRRTVRRLGRAVAALALVLACAGCTATPPAPAPSTALPDGVSVSVFQNRFDYAERVLEIRVSNDGPADFALVSASFTSPQFTDAARYADSLTLSPGMIRNLPVRLADPVCTDDSRGPATVTLAWTVAGGGTASASVLPPDDTGALERMRAEDCLVAAVDSVVTITPAERLRLGANGSAWLDLTVTPTGQAGGVTIDRIGGTTLLEPAAGEDWPVGLTIDAASPRRTISLDLRPARCDPHAIAEDKRGAVFPLYVRPEGRPAGTYNLTVSDALRREIYAWITARCAG